MGCTTPAASTTLTIFLYNHLTFATNLACNQSAIIELYG